MKILPLLLWLAEQEDVRPSIEKLNRVFEKIRAVSEERERTSLFKSFVKSNDLKKIGSRSDVKTYPNAGIKIGLKKMNRVRPLSNFLEGPAAKICNSVPERRTANHRIFSISLEPKSLELRKIKLQAY